MGETLQADSDARTIGWAKETPSLFGCAASLILYQISKGLVTQPQIPEEGTYGTDIGGTWEWVSA